MRRVLSAVGTVVSWIFLIGLLLVCVGPLLASSIYLDRNGVLGPGVVTGKDENITPSSRSNSWFRRLTVTVSYQPRDQSWPETITVGVDTATYDQLRIGSEVRVRYQPDQRWRQFPLISARLENQSTLTFFAIMADSDWSPIALGLFAIVLFFRLISVRTLFWRVVLGTLLVLNIGAIVVFSIRPAVLFDAGRPRLTTMASVRDVERITMDPGTSDHPSSELLRPFDRVVLELDPQGDGGTVVAVDDIDVGSWSGLEFGAPVEVSYPVDNPREAQIVGATRHHRVINWLDAPLEIGLYIVGFGVLSLLGYIGRMLFRRLRDRRIAGRLGP